MGQGILRTRWRVVLAMAGVALAVVIIAVIYRPDRLIANFAGEQPAKATLVAALIAVFGVLVSQLVNTLIARSGRNHQSEIEDRRAQHDALQGYLDQMGEILNDKTIEKPEGERRRALASARTIATLELVDPTRKRILLKFLSDTGLISREKRIVNLSGANLSHADLRGLNLAGVNLRGANLRYADFRSTTQWVTHGRLETQGIDYELAHMASTNLRGAELKGAILWGADFSDASINNADFSGAKVELQQLEKADGYRDAIMPSGRRYGVPRGGKTRREAPLLPLYDTKITQFSPFQLFSKQFLSASR